jgi:type III secretory pathway component EscS
MKRWPIVMAAIAGAVIAFFVEITVGTALSLRASLPAAAKVSLVILCPAIYLGWHSAWLPPILNAILYAAIAFGIAKWRIANKRANSK